MTRASVLIPTHDHHTTLPLTVDSVLRQSVTDLEVLLIGDGVTGELREAIEQLLSDSRVRFLDNPKGPNHGERYRHDAILAAESDAIFYLCDDDLFLPTHVEDLLALLEQNNFVQSLNGYCRPDGEVQLFAGDLADLDHVAAILDESLRFNSVSVTGTAHSRAFYLAVGDRWDTTPDGQWPDHHQWRKLLRHPAYRGATSSRMTALQLPTSDGGRDSWTPQARFAELQGWAELVAAPDGQERVDELVARAALRMAAEGRVELARVRQQVAALASRLGQADLEILALQGHLERVAAAHGATAALAERTRRRLADAEARLAAKNATIARLRARLRSSPVE